MQTRSISTIIWGNVRSTDWIEFDWTGYVMTATLSQQTERDRQQKRACIPSPSQGKSRGDYQQSMSGEGIQQIAFREKLKHSIEMNLMQY